MGRVVLRLAKLYTAVAKVLWSILVELTQTNDEAWYRGVWKYGSGWVVESKLQCDVGYMPTQKIVERENTLAF
jgi:hypothetical protein